MNHIKSFFESNTNTELIVIGLTAVCGIIAICNFYRLTKITLEEPFARMFWKIYRYFYNKQIKDILAKNNLSLTDVGLKDISKQKQKIQNIIYKINNNYLKKFSLSEEEQLLLLDFKAEYIKNIKNPTINAQIKALKESAFLIKYINKPCNDIQIMAINISYNAINFIRGTVCEEAQKLFIEKTGKLNMRITSKKLIEEFCKQKAMTKALE